VPITVSMHNNILWDVTPCSLVKVHRCFTGIFSLHLQDPALIQARIRRKTELDVHAPINRHKKMTYQITRRHIYRIYSFHSFINGSTVLCWALATFHYRKPMHCRQDNLDGGSARSKASTYTQNKRRHPCLEWDSNPRSQCSSGRRQLMP
jgi:hypothetical protein